MVLAPTGTVRPAVALNREEARQSGSFEAPGQRALGRPVTPQGETRPAISRATLMVQLSPTSARVCETSPHGGLTLPVHGPTLIPWTTGRGSNEQAFISRSFSSSLAHVRG
jgi:hypothetical protein